MAKKRCKRAQITLFLIIGIFMLFAVGFLLFVASQTRFLPRETGIEQSVSQLVAQCLKKRVIESYALTGIDADRTRRYVDHELLSCADLTVFEDQADISHGDVISTVRVSDRMISTEIELPITIRQGDSIIKLNKFNYHLPRYYTTKLPLDANGRLSEGVFARSADDRLELYLQPGTIALTNDEQPLEEITIHTRTITQRDPVLYYYTVYDLQPHGAYFQPKAKLRIKYVPSFNIENALQIVKREIDSNFWKEMESRPDTQRHMIETEIVGFSEVGLDPECEDTVYVKGEIGLAEDDYGKCSGEYKIELTGNGDKALCGLYLVDSAVEDSIEEQGFRMNYDIISAALYDQELTTQDLHDSEVLEIINIAINNKVRPNMNKFFVKVKGEEECGQRKADLVFRIIGKNIECGNIDAGQCCDDITGCQVSDDPIDLAEPPELDEPEPCGSKKGIVIHLRDTLLNPDYWPLYVEEAKELVGTDGWVLEDVEVVSTPIGWVHDFTQAVKDAGMKPIIRLSPKETAQGFDPVVFANYAYDIGEGLEPPGYFVQVCNEPNGEKGWSCEMSAEEYAENMLAFIDKLHELDPDERVKVVSAGLDPTGSIGYAETLFNYRVVEEDGTETVFHDAIDIWGSHAYDEAKWKAEMDIVAKENIPVILTEAGFPVDDPRYEDLCTGEDVTKLWYHCVDPLWDDYGDLQERTKEIDVDYGECDRNKWGLCKCEEEWPANCCDQSIDPDCDPCECYEYPYNELCCGDECKLWCIIKWEEGEKLYNWRLAHEDFANYMVERHDAWSSEEWEHEDLLIGITPFLLFDGKEITGDPVERGGEDLKFDYYCTKPDNWRPYYWEYVQYEGEENGVTVPIHRECEGISYPYMEDPYRYPVFEPYIINEQYPTYNCPFLPSGYDEDVEGEAIPPGELPEIPSEEGDDGDGESGDGGNGEDGGSNGDGDGDGAGDGNGDGDGNDEYTPPGELPSVPGEECDADSPFSFTGKRCDYALWVRNGFGAFNINDDDGKLSPLVNDALLWLAFKDSDAKQRYHDHLISLKNEDYDFPDNGQRQFADVLESYLVMRDENTFTIQEQRELEDWFKETTYDLKEERRANYQAVGAGMAAVSGYVLKTTKTGTDYTRDVNKFWNYAREAQSFDTGWSPTENSAHYINYIVMTEVRVAAYVDDGVILNTLTGKKNFARLIEWVIKIHPHNGNSPAFGSTYERDNLRPVFNILHAGAFYLKDYDLELAYNSKWLATQMFKYSLTHNQETTWTNHPAGRFESSPIWVWRYVDDNQPMQNPSITRFGSGTVYRHLSGGWGGWDSNPGSLKLDKIILRDGWDDDSLYIQIEAAPDSHKNQEYANSITQIVYGPECFSTDHTGEGNAWDDAWWTQRNVASPPGPDTDVNLISFTDGGVVTSITEKNGWTRTVKLYKTGDRRIEVTDQLPSVGNVYWHFQGNPTWKADGSGVVLEKNGVKLDVSWTGTIHKDVTTGVINSGCCNWGWGYISSIDREVVLNGQSVYTTTFRPIES